MVEILVESRNIVNQIVTWMRGGRINPGEEMSKRLAMAVMEVIN